MEIEKMNLTEVIERLAALDEEVRDMTEVADVEKATEEKKALLERKAELEALEERKATAAALSTGEIEGTKKEVGGITKMEEKRFTVDSVEYRDAYLKKLMGKNLSVEERTALTDAADLIPTETLNQIYGKLAENPLIAEIDALHIPGYVSVPVATTVDDANWVAMGTAATDSADVIDSVSLTAKKLIKTVEITADIQAMSIPAFQTWLVNKLVEKMETAICAAILNGAGTTEATGITSVVTASSAISSPTLAKLAKFMAEVGTAYHTDAVWVMSAATFFNKIVPIANDSNGVLVMNGIDYQLLGHKVVLDGHALAKVGSEQSATEHIFFGSFKKGYVFNYGEDITIKADDSVGFRAGSTVYRAMALCDGNVVDADAFAFAAIS